MEGGYKQVLGFPYLVVGHKTLIKGLHLGGMNVVQRGPLTPDVMGLAASPLRLLPLAPTLLTNHRTSIT